MQPTIGECPLLRLYLNETRRNYKQNEKRFLRHLQNTILKIKQRKDLCQGVWRNLLNEHNSRCFKASTGNRTYLWESDAFTSSTVVVVKLTNLAKSFRDISLSWYTFVDICIHFCSLKATIHQILNQGIRSRLSWHLIAIPPSKLQLVVLFNYTLFYFHMQNYNPMIAIKCMGFLPVVLSFPV